MTGSFVKRYPDRESCRRAADNHRWLASLGPPVDLPALVDQRETSLEFDHVQGRHAEPADLPLLAGHLGAVHAQAYERELHRARLGRPYLTLSGHCIPDFLTPRLGPIRQRLSSGTVRGSLLDADAASRLLVDADGRPAAFYKDTNPRNVLITPSGPVMVDFDDLTLAPFGYDLAKLIVTLTMTHGPIPHPEITNALDTYNLALTQISARPVSWQELMAWAKVHHILTSPYVGHGGGYRHSWDEHRPLDHTDPAPAPAPRRRSR